MKKILFISAIAALGFASCANDDVLDTNAAGDKNNTDAIAFNLKTSVASRATHVGADAATLLNNKFVVAGYKGGTAGTPASVVTTTVFDHYNVEWATNTAGTTESNTSDWEYVGKTKNTLSSATDQTIKYWDYSVGQYDFIAFSFGTAAQGTDVTVTAVTPSTAKSSTGGAYTVQGTTDNLAKFYIADLVTAYNPNSKAAAVNSAPSMGNEVKITFRNITAKLRVALYETVPGYSVKDVKFYASDAATENATNITLYSQEENIYSAGTYTVYFPTTDDATKSDYNKAHLVMNATGKAKSATYGSLNYTNAKTIEGSSVNYLGETSTDATYIADKAWTNVLPNESGAALTLRCDYTLVSNDGSKETITIHGAKAVIPAQYCQWKSNYAYTYLFKISDNTNGSTEKLGGIEGLTPITFDAVVVDATDANAEQQTITTVATPSITTYGYNSTAKEVIKVTAQSEYPAATTTDIYVSVMSAETTSGTAGTTMKTDLNSNGKLYTVTGVTAPTEALVMDALNIQASATDAGVITGRNGVVLTPATEPTYPTTVPGVDGNDITFTANSVAKFTATATATVYAYVYDFTGSTTPTVTYIYTAVAGDGSTAAGTDEYYTDPDGQNVVANGTVLASGTIYYKKYTNNNKSYAVKVIKTVV